MSKSLQPLPFEEVLEKPGALKISARRYVLPLISIGFEEDTYFLFHGPQRTLIATCTEEELIDQIIYIEKMAIAEHEEAELQKSTQVPRLPIIELDL